MSSRPNHVILAALAVGFSSSGVIASGPSITYLTQHRLVAANVDDQLNHFHDSASMVASDFGPFNAVASVAVPGGPGSASAWQESTLDPFAGISVVVQVSAVGSTNYMQIGNAIGDFYVTFEVLEPTVAVVYMFGGFSLSGPDLYINAMSSPMFGPESVALQPGRYGLSVGASCTGTEFQGTGDGAWAYITVPSAGSLVLVLAGMGVCATRRRRVQRRI